jgi:hypothetical protein
MDTVLSKSIVKSFGLIAHISCSEHIRCALLLGAITPITIRGDCTRPWASFLLPNVLRYIEFHDSSEVRGGMAGTGAGLGLHAPG